MDSMIQLKLFSPSAPFPTPFIHKVTRQIIFYYQQISLKEPSRFSVLSPAWRKREKFWDSQYRFAGRYEKFPCIVNLLTQHNYPILRQQISAINLLREQSVSKIVINYNICDLVSGLLLPGEKQFLKSWGSSKKFTSKCSNRVHTGLEKPYLNSILKNQSTGKSLKSFNRVKVLDFCKCLFAIR